MKKIFFILFLELVCIFLLIACSSISIPGLNSAGSGDPSIWSFVLALVLALYEIIIRLVPTVGNYSFVHTIIRFLKWISDNLNNKKLGP